MGSVKRVVINASPLITLCRSQLVEPDECFYIARTDNIRGKDKISPDIDPPPDLASVVMREFRVWVDDSR